MRNIPKLAADAFCRGANAPLRQSRDFRDSRILYQAGDVFLTPYIEEQIHAIEELSLAVFSGSVRLIWKRVAR
jgi:hypothetical protein